MNYVRYVRRKEESVDKCGLDGKKRCTERFEHDIRMC